ncbi:MAG: protocatechuate 3,4-dioxygenase [Gammaproteobacteria bacterium]
MVWSKHDYDKLPGTYVFDGRLANKGYNLNKFFMSLNDAPNRDEFDRDEEAYLRKFGVSEEQIDAVKKRDWLRMLELGGNVYFVAKLATHAGCNMQDIGSQMTGIPLDEFKARLVAAGK